jgi:DNA-binding transcriptional LysR family regulator
MEIRQLRYFLAVAEELSFTRAAERCFISQPPLSRQIAILEREIGVRLLKRDNHSVSLTEAGRAFLEDARHILIRVDGAKQRAVMAASGLTGKLTIGFGSSTAYALLPSLVHSFRSKFPNVELLLRSMPVINQIEALRLGEIDIGVLRLPVFDELICTQFVHREGLVVALPETHALAKRKKIRIEDLADCEFIAYERSRGMGYHNDLMALCRIGGFTPKILQEASPTEGVIGAVACGNAVAIVPSSALRLRVDRVVYRPLISPLNTPHEMTVVDFAVAWLRDSVSPTAAGFVSATKDHKMVAVKEHSK